jgi:mannose-6-phosphate isomerase-like protein (cupin superfamily)
MSNTNDGARVAVIRDVYEQGTGFFERASPGRSVAAESAPTVVGRTSGKAEFRGHNLWPDGRHLVQLAEVAPGDRKYLHRHPEAETVWVILDGTGEFYSDFETVIPVEAGMICHAFPQEWHGLGNTGTTPLRYLSVEGPFPPRDSGVDPSEIIEYAE